MLKHLHRECVKHGQTEEGGPQNLNRFVRQSLFLSSPAGQQLLPGKSGEIGLWQWMFKVISWRFDEAPQRRAFGEAARKTCPGTGAFRLVPDW